MTKMSMYKIMSVVGDALACVSNRLERMQRTGSFRLERSR